MSLCEGKRPRSWPDDSRVVVVVVVRGVDPVLKVGGRGTNLYTHICMHNICIVLYIYYMSYNIL